ncbi:MAG: tetratricopeptide repeat-containing sensor histidine kinase [Cyclobacteriaceae bacterium]|nr:tetratricopeptide repeat-containing sensor histidine kinase [Cyclobacteriaceae bacterium]
MINTLFPIVFFFVLNTFFGNALIISASLNAAIFNQQQKESNHVLLKKLTEVFDENPDDGIELALELLEDEEVQSDSDLLVKIHCLLAEAYQSKQVGRLAIKYYHNALTHIPSNQNIDLELQIHLELGNEYYQLKEFSLAKEHFSEVLKLSNTYENTSELSQALHSLGNIDYFLGNYQQAKSHYFKALKIRRYIGDYKAIAASLNNIANIYNRLGVYDSAVYYYERSIDVKERVGDKKGIASSLKNLAAIEYFQDQYIQALDYNLKALRISEDLNDSVGLAYVYNNMALIYERLEKLEVAASHYFKALEIKESLNDRQSVAVTLNNLGMIFLKLNRFDESIEYLNKSLKISEDLGEKEGISAGLNNIAKVFEKQGNYRVALDYFLQSLEIDENIQNKRGIVQSSTGLAGLFIKLDQYDMAKNYAMQALELGLTLGAKKEIYECHNYLSKIYERNAEFEKALFHHKQHKAYGDSIFNSEVEKKTAWLQANYENEKQLAILKSEQKAAELEAEKLLQEHRFQRNLLILSSLALLLIAGIIYRSFSKQKKAKQLLHLRSKELEEANAVKSKLFSIIGHDLKGPIAGLYKLLELYQKGLLNQNEFEKVVPQLYKNVGSIMISLDNLLKWSMVEMEMLEAKPGTIHLKTAVAELSDFFSTLFEQKKIKFIISIPHDILIFADVNHISVILRNLLNNAIKYSYAGGEIEIAASDEGSHIKIMVRDTGMGMSDDELAQLFKKNISHSKAGTRGEKGTGLGLKLCKHYAEENKGDIWVESQPQKGTKFYITLPKAMDIHEKTA